MSICIAPFILMAMNHFSEGALLLHKETGFDKLYADDEVQMIAEEKPGGQLVSTEICWRSRQTICTKVV